MPSDAPPSQDDVRARVVGAAARLLNEHGAPALTTRGVAQAAGVQAPTIYRLFGDKDGLVEAVAEHVMATYVAAKRSAVADTELDPVADLRAGWRLHVEFGLANPGLYALLSNASGRSEPSAATAAGIEVLRARVRGLAAAGLLRVDEARALDMIHAAGTGTVLALLEKPAAQRDLGLVDDLFDAVAGRILAAEPVTSGDDRITTAVVTLAALAPELPGLSDAERALLDEWLRRALAAADDSTGARD
ncbi:TetR/AcrR family transcriptional regulator [Nocardioides lijunqiniae]|uniref:TetR/AcrR family transcriptional regulator n=1 Tax=Nocardioides lijunqiniae TaxID=2760832 RepID=UPI0018789A47|nr:TetR/AcrR family transcriptional regulator [Nocardioides lijunqiniae]